MKGLKHTISGVGIVSKEAQLILVIRLVVGGAVICRGIEYISKVILITLVIDVHIIHMRSVLTAVM